MDQQSSSISHGVIQGPKEPLGLVAELWLLLERIPLTPRIHVA
jgi:hypothetical protein